MAGFSMDLLCLYFGVWYVEVEQGKAQGEAEQRGVVQPAHLQQGGIEQ
jgi:hypothetical protein